MKVLKLIHKGHVSTHDKCLYVPGVVTDSRPPHNTIKSHLCLGTEIT